MSFILALLVSTVVSSADTTDRCLYSSLSPRSASREVQDTFQELDPNLSVDFLNEMLAQPPRFSLPPRLLELVPDPDSRLAGSLAAIHHVVSHLKVDGQDVTETQAERLALHLGKKMIALPKVKEAQVVVTHNGGGENQGFTSEKKVKSNQGLILSDLELLFEAPIRDKPSVAQQRILDSLFDRLVLNADKRANSYAQGTWVRGALERQGRASEEIDQVINWITNTIKDRLNTDYSGPAGLRRLAQESFGDHPFAARTWARGYLDKAEVEWLEWPFLDYGITYAALDKVQSEYHSAAFQQAYGFLDGRARLARDLFNGSHTAASRAVRTVGEPDAPRRLGWGRSYEMQKVALDTHGKFKSEYLGLPGLKRLVADVAHLQNTRGINAREGEEQRKRIRSLARSLFASRMDETKWNESRGTPKGTKEAFIEKYRGVGILNYAEEHGLALRLAFKRVRAAEPDWIEELGWREIRMGSGAAQEMLTELYPQPGTVNPKYQGLAGKSRLFSTYFGGRRIEGSYTLKALSSPEQLEALGYDNEDTIVRVPQRKWNEAAQRADKPAAKMANSSLVESSMRLNGRLLTGDSLKQEFLSEEGLALYASLFHFHSATQAIRSVRARFGDAILQALDWPQKLSSKDHVKDALDKKHFPLVNESGQIDPYWRGETGKRHFIEMTGRTSRQAEDFAARILSPRDREELDWEGEP